MNCPYGNAYLVACFAAVVSLFGPSAQSARGEILIDTVPVGDPGNAKDVHGAGWGTVDYLFRMGTYEVTNDQYAAFLNAKAASDPTGLYSSEMGSRTTAGITRSGSDANYTYAVKPNFGNKPVNCVSFYDALRFCNWLHNGQGNGDTETGAYTLSLGNVVTRNSDATWFVPSENEWYKAAYYDPTLNDGTGGYYDYATRSNNLPVVASADEFGNISNPGFNVVNYDEGADWNGHNGNVTSVGSAGSMSASCYGTSDQNGNVFEWLDEPFPSASSRISRGGSWQFDEGDLAITYRMDRGLSAEYDNVGFRVASISSVPEPSTLTLTALGLVGAILLFCRTR